MMRSGFQTLTEKCVTFRDGADVVSSGSAFQTRGPATEKTLLPTVESLTGGTSRLLELAERSVRRPGWSATRARGPRYRGADPCMILYVSSAILYAIRFGDIEAGLRKHRTGRPFGLSSTSSAIGIECSDTVDPRDHEIRRPHRQRSVCYAEVSLWNNLSDDLKTITSFSKFKAHLKLYLQIKSYADWIFYISVSDLV